MANRYVRSSDGASGDNGTTWALANDTLANSIADSAAGDSHYISDNHSESTGASVTLTFKGTYTSPDRVYCVDDAGNPEPPTALATTAIVATGNGAYNITINGVVYVYGITFRCGVGATATNSFIHVATDNYSVHRYESCVFEVATTNSSTGSRINIGNDAGGNQTECRWLNCEVKFGGVAQVIAQWQGNFYWTGGKISTGSAAITSIFRPSMGAGFGRQHNCFVEGVDFSAAASNANLIDYATVAGNSRYVFRNCKLPSSCVIRSGSTLYPYSRIEVYNCDSGDTNYRTYIDDYHGTVRDSISAGYTIYRDGGAGGTGLYNGATQQGGMSWLMTGVANCEFPSMVLRSPEIVQYVGTTGGKTITVEIVHDGAAAMTDQEVWLEVTYLGTSGVPQSLFTSDRCGLLATAAAQATSSATWTGDSGTGPNSSSTWHTLKLVTPSFTVNELGYVHAVVCVAANKAVFVDPVLTVASA